MDEKIARVLEEYESRLEIENALIRNLSPEEMRGRVDEFLIPVGPDVGRFMHDLAVAAKAKIIIELGTSYGYSAVWLASAARQTGGKLLSIDLARDKQVYALERLQRAGLESYADFICGDARTVLDLIAGPVDLVLIDLWKDLYIPCFDAVRPKLASPSYLVADNMTYPAVSHADAEKYRAHIRTRVDQTILLPIGNGIEVSRIGS